MATNTTNFNLIKPGVNDPVDANIWGNQLNTNFDSLDTLLRAIANNSKGTSAPTSPAPQAGQIWVDSTTATAWNVQIYDGTSWVSIGTLNSSTHSFAPANVSGSLLGVQTFTSSGTYTPASGMSYCIIECIGGGGAGGGSASTSGGQAAVGGGGGAGAYSKSFIDAATIGVSQTVTIGAGGVGVSGSTGNNGGTTSLGSIVTAGGGSGGTAGSAGGGVLASNPGPGGAAGTGNIIAQNGLAGQLGFGVGGGQYTGAGGNTIYGISGASIVSATTSNGNNGTLGSGGGGSISYNGGTARTGGSGGDGIVIVTEYA